MIEYNEAMMEEDCDDVCQDDDIVEDTDESNNEDVDKIVETIAANVRASALGNSVEEVEDDDVDARFDYGGGPCRSAFKPDMSKCKLVAWKNDDGTYSNSLKVGDQFWIEAAHLPWRDTELYRVSSFGEDGAVWVRSLVKKSGGVFSLTKGIDCGYRYYEGKMIAGHKIKEKKSRKQRRRRNSI